MVVDAVVLVEVVDADEVGVEGFRLMDGVDERNRGE